MKIYNDGENAIVTSKGRLDPKKAQELSDDEGKRLLNLYSTLKNAKKIGEESKAPPEEKEPSEKSKSDTQKEKGKGKGK